MKKLFIAEKPSVATEFAKVLKVDGTRRNGYIESNDYIVTWCVGHLVTMSYPEAYDEKYKMWRYDTLPFVPSEWKYEVIESVKNQFDVVKSLLTRDDVDTIYVCTDSGREGEYIYRLIDQMANVQNKAKKRVWIDSQTEEEILRGIKEAKEKGLTIPVVYNTSGYEKAETVALLKDTVDIFLTDFKYIKPETAKKYSNAENYVSFAKAALGEMVKIAPSPTFESSLMTKGVIVRVLLLPDHLIETKMIVKYLFETYGDNIYISLMNQYTPIKKHEYENLNRTVTDYEYKSLVEYAMHLGIKNAFIQQGGTAKESFIPEFDLSGI